MKSEESITSELATLAVMTRDVLDHARRGEWDAVIELEAPRQRRLVDLGDAVAGRRVGGDALLDVEEWRRQLEADHTELDDLLTARLSEIARALAAIEQGVRAQAAYRLDTGVPPEIEG